jgi:hypothetical protein
MFKLRKQHLDAFEAQIVHSFASRVVAHAKAVWPAECEELGDAALAEMVASATKRGAALGLSAELDMVRFIDLGFILAKDFETNPLAAWVRPILADRTLPPGAMMDRIYQRMEEEFALIEKRKGPKYERR